MSDEVIALNFGGEHMACVDVTYKAPGKWKTQISAAPRAEDLDYSNAAVWDCLTVDRLVLAAFIAAHYGRHGQFVSIGNFDFSECGSAERALNHLVTYFRFRLLEAGRLREAESLLPEYEALFVASASTETTTLPTKLLATTKAAFQAADWSDVFAELDRDGDVWLSWMEALYIQADYHNIWVEPGRF